jgi:disease resistance protein RPM1
MEFATGAMSTLIPKLGMLLVEEYNLQKGLKKGINGLRKELSIIEAALEKVSDVPLDQLNPSVKIWANDVRELSYTIEDSLDSFMVRVEGLEPDKPHTFSRFIKKTCKKDRNLKIRREIASDIEDVKIQVKEVKERYDRYKGVFNNSSARIEVDPRLLAMYSKVSDLVGIEEAMDELMKLLFDQNDASNNNLKTVSVVGFGGLGKTTLAKGIYDKLYNKFICGGFVPVGRNPDVKKVLRDILHELDKQKYMNITASQMDVRQLMDEVRGFLGNKRYVFNSPPGANNYLNYMSYVPIYYSTRVLCMDLYFG